MQVPKSQTAGNARSWHSGTGQQERWKLCQGWPGGWSIQPGGRAKGWGRKVKPRRWTSGTMLWPPSHRSRDQKEAAHEPQSWARITQKSYNKKSSSEEFELCTFKLSHKKGQKFQVWPFGCFPDLGFSFHPHANYIRCSKPHSSKSAVLAFFNLKTFWRADIAGYLFAELV